MKNKVGLKRNLLYILLIFIIFLIIFISFDIYKYEKFTLNYNNKINSLVGNLLEKYPDLSKNEIIEIISNNEYYNNVFEEYGIDINSESVILKNNILIKNYLIIDSSLILFLGVILIYIFYNYNKNIRNEINDITKLIEEINHKNYKLNIDNMMEGEFSILTNEIYKTTIMLNEQSLNELKDKINLKKSLSDITHQLKTPLTSILIILDNILENPNMNNQEKESLLLKIKKEITKINLLVQNILTLSKFEANVINFINSDIYINDIIKNAIDNVSSICDLKNININYNENNNLKIYGDLKWQVEAITNILKNAIEYSNNDSYIDIIVNDNKLYKEIIIKDYGIGMKSEDIKHIFDRFYKGINSSSNSVGIGLSLAKSIIEQNNGTILVKSNIGKGTTFKIKYYL